MSFLLRTSTPKLRLHSQEVMRPSYADTIKLVEANYFPWEFNMRVELSRKGQLAHIIKSGFDMLSDRSTVQWKTDDLKGLGVIAGDVSLTYQVYIRGATTAADPWRMIEGQFNRNTLKNRLLITKKLHNFKMKSSTQFAAHVNKFKEIVLQMETIGEPLYETRPLVLLLGSLTDEYRMITTVLENTPNMTLAYAIQAGGYQTVPLAVPARSTTRQAHLRFARVGFCVLLE
ncbi:unnamed protein product [Phytophthora fragariaefolia]|uniref:Unnamed protein product n=1 Tax=Phytophthora fragariaefolia TaxID=1490495 RepID=A0A9W6YC96_9STRA|nr:unnamed protein product [Phytophthora fragariaefolia]